MENRRSIGWTALGGLSALAGLMALQQSSSGDEQRQALNELVRELARLDYRAEHGVPYYLNSLRWHPADSLTTATMPCCLRAPECTPCGNDACPRSF